MVCTKCYTCGGEYHWDWTEAFAKFGFEDGDGQVHTGEVGHFLESCGYVVESNPWGCHNYVIGSVRKDGVELIPFDNPDYKFGYDDPRKYFPDHLVQILDKEFPTTYLREI